MRKISLTLCFIIAFTIANAQISMAKMIGKDASAYGTGYGLFTYMEFPLAYENNSIRLELMDLAMFPLKGEKFFTTTKDMKAFFSIKLGYKHVFSETRTGFYIAPLAGYGRPIIGKEGEDEAKAGNGIALAMEGGYALEVGQKGNTINAGLKYEYDYATPTYQIQSVEFRIGFAFGIFKN